jgi:ubiquinone/menaquinone biosynthesis C-methylase UbiE
VRPYYEARAAEYDATTYELALRDPANARDLATLERLVADFPPGRTLDIGCGTGWLTRFLRGTVVALDRSEAMLDKARERLDNAVLVWAAVPPLPFPGRSFDRALAAHLYGHFVEDERQALRAEALRVAGELIVVEQAWEPGASAEGWERRSLADGSEHCIYKRYFTAAELAAELGGWVVLDTPSYVAAATRASG